MNLLKVDFPPLLGEGIHEHSLGSLKVLAVDGFPDSKRRAVLFDMLDVYVGLLEQHGLQADIIIDGSFMCRKHEPDDVDLLVIYDPSCVRDLTEPTWNAVDNLLNTSYALARFRLHVHAVPSDDAAGKLFWLKKFGTQRDEITPKGLALLRLKP